MLIYKNLKIINLNFINYLIVNIIIFLFLCIDPSFIYFIFIFVIELTKVLD